MTEAEWLACTDPMSMLTFLQGKASDRKLRLFACGVCRRMGYRIGADGEEAVKVAERFADDLVDHLDLVIAYEVRESQDQPITSHKALLPGMFRDLPSICLLTDIGERQGLTLLALLSTQFEGATLFREIFGNPFRPVPDNPSWLTSTAVTLAESIYEGRAFDRLPILADALEDAGCDNADVLAHCRGDGPHVRGCWVVDLVLGKS